MVSSPNPAAPGPGTGSERIDIFTDGACQGSSGQGGWAVVLYEDGRRRIISGNDRRTTGNRMELTAVIQGLDAAPRDRPIVINSENRHLVETITRGRERTANLDLWERLDRLRAELQVSWWWVRSVRGNPGSEIAGRVANMEAGLFQTRDGPGRRPGGVPSGGSHRGGRPAGNRSSSGPRAGNQRSGAKQTGNKPNDNRPGGNQRAGARPSGSRPSGTRPNGNRQGGPQPARQSTRRPRRGAP